MTELAYRTPVAPFAQAMACGQKVKFSGNVTGCQLKCGAKSCTSKWELPTTGIVAFEFATEDCIDDSVSIYGNGFAATLPKVDYELGGNTWIVGLLKNLGHFIQPEGTLYLKRLWPTTFQEIVNGQKQSFFGYMLQADLQILPNTMTVQIEIGIDTRTTGLNQLILLRMHKDEIFLKRKGILDANP
ncbi:MAG: hypothetical protein ACXWC9_07415 [Pseudobdellovibrionaceae bacterium]